MEKDRHVWGLLLTGCVSVVPLRKGGVLHVLTVRERDLPSLSISFGSGEDDDCVSLSNGE